AQPLPSFPRALERGPRPRHCRRGISTGRETWEWSGTPRESPANRSRAFPWCALARRPRAPERAGERLLPLPLRGNSLRGLLDSRTSGEAVPGGSAKDNGALFVAQILSRHFMNFFGGNGSESVEDSVHKLRLVVEERETGKQMHQAVLRHVAATPAFQGRVIIGTPFHLELLQFAGGDSVLLGFANHGIKRSERRFAGKFRLVQNFRGHLRRPVVTEQVIDAAFDFHGNLFLEDQFAMNSAGSAAVQRLIKK